MIILYKNNVFCTKQTYTLYKMRSFDPVEKFIFILVANISLAN